MNVVAKLDVWGTHPEPHSFNGKIVKGENGRSKIAPAPNPALQKWKQAVRHLAHLERNGREPYAGDVAVELTFYAKTPTGKRDGDRWSQRVRWDAKSTKKCKARKLDSTQPDADNLAKSLLDSLTWIIIADDVQVCDLRVRRLYGPKAGVSIVVHSFD